MCEKTCQRNFSPAFVPEKVVSLISNFIQIHPFQGIKSVAPTSFRQVTTFEGSKVGKQNQLLTKSPNFKVQNK